MNQRDSRDILDMSREELREAVGAVGGCQPYRADQILSWVYGKGATSTSAMTNLPADLREALADRFTIGTATVARVLSDQDGTVKLLVELDDGEAVESVGLPDAAGPGKLTACLSTQVGCRYGCPFCQSGRGGLVRNLRPGEIVQQALLTAEQFPGRRLSHVVLMGVGEPLDNYDAALAAVRTINEPWGMGIGARRITISTCGVVPGIRRLAGEGLQLNLAVSLHAASDELRDRFVPANKEWPLRELVAACREYVRATGRQVTFEYVLMPGVNSTEADASRLASLLAGLECAVNVIGRNPGLDESAPEPDEAAVAEFVNILGGVGLAATARKPRGLSVGGACGQLRARRPGDAP